MFSKLFKKFMQPSSRTSRRRSVRPLLECLETRCLLTTTGPMTGVLWTKEVFFHGHFDGAAAHMPKASDFQVEYHWGDGTTTIATDVVQPQPNMNNYKAVASHIFSQVGNTPERYEIEITNLLDPNYHWIQESRVLMVQQGPIVVPAEPLPEQFSANDPPLASETPTAEPLSGGIEVTEPISSPIAPTAPAGAPLSGGTDLTEPVVSNDPPAAPSSPPAAPLPGGIDLGNSSPIEAVSPAGQVQPVQMKPLEGVINGQEERGYVEQYGAPKMIPTKQPPAVKKPLVSGTSKVAAPMKAMPPKAAPTPPRHVGRAIENPTSKDITLEDPVQMRLNYKDVSGANIDELVKKLEEKDPAADWNTWVNDFKKRVQGAVDAAAKQMPAQWRGQTFIAHTTLTFKAKDKVTFTVQQPDKSFGPVPALQKWVNLLNSQLKKAGLQ